MIDRLVSNGYELNLSDGIATPVTFSIADFREPDKRKRDVSKSIKLPGTANNLLFFSGAFSFHVTDSEISFDSTAKTPAKFYKRGVEIMPNAVIQLKSVDLVNENYVFNIHLFSESVNFFLLLSKINVNELNWSEYQYTLNRQAIKDSWLTPIGSGYKYPLIEYRQRSGTLSWNTTDLIPYVFLREVFVKMMEYVNVEFESPFIDSDRFKSILYGFGGGEVTATLNLADQLSRRVELDAISFDYSAFQILTEFSNVYTFFSEVPFNNQICTTLTETTDALSQFDQSTSANTFTIARTGSYNLNIQGVLFAEVTNAQFPTFPIDIYRFGSMGVNVIKNGVIIQTQVFGDVFFADSRNYNINMNTSLSCQVGDVITITFSGVTIELNTQIEGGNITGLLEITETTPLTMDLTAIDGAITDGSVVDLWRYIPSQKCSEVFSSIIKMFNLYYDNPDINGVVSIKPEIDYYSPSNDFDDVTQIVDYNEPVIFTTMGNDYGKDVKFKFKECKDTDAVNYFDEFGKRYNDYEFTQGSYYAKGEQVTQIAFSTIVPFQIATGIIIPRMCKVEESGLSKIQRGEPRIMMWNGMKPGTWTLRNTDNSALSEVLTQYPCVHHFDNWEDPEFDLSFQLVDELQYNATLVTSANLFSVYHYTSVNEIISPSAQLLTLYLKLTANDINNMTFSKLKMINGALFKLNQISDFDSNVTESTKVELIKVLESTRKKSSKYVNPTGTTAPNPTQMTLEGTITQTGTNAPLLTAFETTGAALTFTAGRYNGTGDYTLIFQDNTFINDIGLVLISGDANAYVSAHNQVTIETNGNNKLNNTSICIKTYI